jgi:hypothetical protein
MEDIALKTKADRIPRPCEYFDLVGGTSTGGLIAIMLGVLGMVCPALKWELKCRAWTNVSKHTSSFQRKCSFPGTYSQVLFRSTTINVASTLISWSKISRTLSVPGCRTRAFLCALNRSIRTSEHRNVVLSLLLKWQKSPMAHQRYSVPIPSKANVVPVAQFGKPLVPPPLPRRSSNLFL